MQRALLVITAVMLSACAGGYPDSAAYRDCEYKAKVATPRTNNAIADGYREGELINMCMANKGH